MAGLGSSIRKRRRGGTTRPVGRSASPFPGRGAPGLAAAGRVSACGRRPGPAAAGASATGGGTAAGGLILVSIWGSVSASVRAGSGLSCGGGLSISIRGGSTLTREPVSTSPGADSTGRLKSQRPRREPAEPRRAPRPQRGTAGRRRPPRPRRWAPRLRRWAPRLRRWAPLPRRWAPLPRRWAPLPRRWAPLPTTPGSCLAATLGRGDSTSAAGVSAIVGAGSSTRIRGVSTRSRGAPSTRSRGVDGKARGATGIAGRDGLGSATACRVAAGEGNGFCRRCRNSLCRGRFGCGHGRFGAADGCGLGRRPRGLGGLHQPRRAELRGRRPAPLPPRGRRARRRVSFAVRCKKSDPAGNVTFRLRAIRSANCRATISSTVLDALFASIPCWVRSNWTTSWLGMPRTSAIL